MNRTSTTLIIAVFLLLSGMPTQAHEADGKQAAGGTATILRVLLFSGTGWYRHPEVPAINGWLTWNRPLLMSTYENYQYLRADMVPAFEAAAMHTLEQDVAALSEAQKIALVTPTPQQRANRDDPEILDILSAKKVLYSLIGAPSPEVQLGYQSLKELLNAE